MTEKDRELSRQLVVGHKRDGRCCYDKEAKRELVEACLQPGISVARMALMNGINANLLRTWIRRYQSQGQPNVGTSNLKKRALTRLSAFVPVVQTKRPAKTNPLQFKVQLPNGVKLDLSEMDRDELSSILEVLSKLPCSASTLG